MQTEYQGTMPYNDGNLGLGVEREWRGSLETPRRCQSEVPRQLLGDHLKWDVNISCLMERASEGRWGCRVSRVDEWMADEWKWKQWESSNLWPEEAKFFSLDESIYTEEFWVTTTQHLSPTPVVPGELWAKVCLQKLKSTGRERNFF